MTRRTWLVLLVALVASSMLPVGPGRGRNATRQSRHRRRRQDRDRQQEWRERNIRSLAQGHHHPEQQGSVLEDLQQGDVVNMKLQRKGDKAIALSIAATSPE